MTSQPKGQQGPLDLIVVEDSFVDAELEVDALREAGQTVEVRVVEDEPAFRAALDERLPDAILSDWTLPLFSGRRALEIAHERCPDVPFIFVSGTISEPAVLEALRHGASDYVYKHQLQHLGPTLLRAVNEARMLCSLCDSEERHRVLFMSSCDAIMTLEPPSWMFTSGNPATIELFGAKDEVDFVSNAPYQLSPECQPDGRPSGEEAKEMIETAMREGSHIFEWTHKRINGEEFPASVLLTRVTLGHKTLLQATVRDITERNRAEEELRKLSRAVEQSPTSVMITDLHGDIEYVNPKFTEVTGFSLEEVRGKNPRILKSGETLSEEYRKLWETITSGGEWHGLFHNKRKDGALFWERASISAVRDSSGAITHFIAVKEDITNQKSLEAQLQQAQKMEAVGQLAGGISHDFNNILTAVIGYAYMLKMKIKDDEDLRDYANRILLLSDRAANLTKSLLAFSRKQLMNPMPEDLNEIIKRVDHLLSRIIGEDIKLQTMLSEKDLIIMADSGQIEQVLMNLATNARDAMPKGGVLTIGTETVDIDHEFIKEHGFGKEGEYALIAVTDTGAGMDRETREKIFEPFFTTKEVGKGTGLGLSMVYGIIKQHEGYINVYSEQGSGTTFRIYLPLIKGKVEEIKPVVIQPIEIATETVLLAEDEDSIREFIKKLLEEYGYKVITAVDGQEAIDEFKAHKDEIQLVVLDVIMPNRNGKEAYDEIKKIRPDIRALFMSGYPADIIQKHDIIEKGFAYIEKPASPTKLLKKIREVLGK